MSQHMCDVGAETVVMNGYAAQCMLVNKDIRRMDVAQKPDGTPPDMPAKADLLIFEVCQFRQACSEPCLCIVTCSDGYGCHALYLAAGLVEGMPSLDERKPLLLHKECCQDAKNSDLRER